MGKRSDRGLPPGIEQSQRRPALVVPALPVAARMERPLLLPGHAPYIPEAGVALEPVAGILAERRDAGFEIAQHLVGVVPLDGPHRRQQRGKDGLRQNIAVARAVGRQAGAREDRPQQRKIQPRVAHGDADVAAAQARARQLPHIRGREAALLLRGGRAVQQDGVRLAFIGLRPGRKQPAEPVRQLRRPTRPARQPLNAAFRAEALRGARKRPPRRARRAERAGIGAVVRERDRHLVRRGHKRGDDAQLRRREIAEAVEVEPLAPGVGLPLEKLPQPQQARDRIVAARFADGEIALIQQPQLGQLLRERAAHLSGRLQKRGRRQQAAQKLLHRGAEAF